VWKRFVEVLVALTLVLGVSSAHATTFFLTAGADPAVAANWGTNADGSGTHPSNFTTGSQIFEFQNGQSATLGANWTVSGSGSAIQIDTNATLDASTFTTANGASTGTFNMQSGATFKTAGTYSALIFGTINAASTFEVNGASTSFLARTYGNFIWNSSAVPAAANDITTGGSFRIEQSTVRLLAASGTGDHTWNLTTDFTIDFGATSELGPGAAANGIINIGGGLTNSGTIVKTSSSGTATINFNGTGTSSVTWGTNGQTGSGWNVNVGSATSTKTINMTDSLNNKTGTVGVFGTLNLGGSSKLNGTGRVTVNNGGTLNLGANNQFNSTTPAPVTLGGGNGNAPKIDAGGFSQGTNATNGIGALTLSSNSTINMTGNSLVHFAASTGAATGALSILNWNGLVAGNGATGGLTADLLKFGAANTDLSFLSHIQFVDPNGVSGTFAAMFVVAGNDGEVVPDLATPVPEPSTWIGAALALAAIGFTQRKRFAKSRKEKGEG
jgi:hypothetical protein